MVDKITAFKPENRKYFVIVGKSRTFGPISSYCENMNSMSLAIMSD